MNARRRFLLQTACTAGTVPWLGAAQACEFQATYLRVTHPWTRATAAAADHAVLCMKFDEVQRADRLVAVRTPIATGAELAGANAGDALSFDIPEGAEIELHELGRHLRLTGLLAPVQVGRQYPLELTFEHSGVLLATLNVDFPALRFR